MNQEQDRVVGLTAFLGVVVIGSLVIYLLLQTQALIRSNENLIIQVGELEKVARSAITSEAFLAENQNPRSGVTDMTQLINALRGELTPLAERVRAIETSIRERSVGNLKPKVTGAMNNTGREYPMPPLPPGLVGEQVSNLPTNGPRGASKDSVEQFETALRKNAARVREQIAAETDLDNPDPAALQRIMIQSQAEMASELSSILPAEDFEAIFPPLIRPGSPHTGR